jgi:putative phosphoribosyl transferase
MAGLPGWLLDAPLFRDRADAGRAVAALLPELGPRTLVVGLARGGVLVAAEVAAAGGWPLDVVAVRKVRHPYQPEFALGAVTPDEDGVYLRSGDGLTEAQLAQAVARAQGEAGELDRRLIAAARWARSGGAERTVAAVPVAARQSVEQVLAEVDLLFCPHVRDDLYAVGIWYADFSQVSDEDVLGLLESGPAHARPPSAA